MTSAKTTLGAGLAATVAMALVACGGATPGAQGPGSTTTTSGMMCKEKNSCKTHGSCAGYAQGQKHSCKGHNGGAGNLRPISKAECDAMAGEFMPYTPAGG